MSKESKNTKNPDNISFSKFKEEVLNDLHIACESREASLLGRKEVLTGKAKFGIFGDGKEVAQLAMAKHFKSGDFRAGYYRDQTFMMASGLLTVQEFFAQLYGHPDIDADPSSGGRQMNAHAATRSLNLDGSWKDLTKIKNSSSDASPTGSQMPRLLGLAYASKFYRNNSGLKGHTGFSNNGDEVAFGTIGDASTSEGLFFETFNAAGVLQVPMVLSVWDDDYGISVSKKHQTTKESISEVLKGFQRDEKRIKAGKNGDGFEIFKVKGWDYASLCETYERAVNISRKRHIPVLIHVEEITQPQGHSTSGSHERYKSKERLKWEDDFDCIKKMKEWILSSAIATQDDINKIEGEALEAVKAYQKEAWKKFQDPIKEEVKEVSGILDAIIGQSEYGAAITEIKSELNAKSSQERKYVMEAVKKALRIIRHESLPSAQLLFDWLGESKLANYERYNSFLYSHSTNSALSVKPINPTYAEDAEMVDGRIILRDNFDALLAKRPELMVFGEDAGKIGGVNQGLEGLQLKYGELRVFDTGIRETTIIGQAIGLALRGLRPIAEIQYLDYLLYGLQTTSDDLATLHYRTKGGQKAPVIIRTRGHRLEGIWHSGSPLGMIINSLRGMFICCPRNMTQAAGFYNTLLNSDDPGMVIESLNGYRIKEKMPNNLAEYKIPLGIPEVITEGTDVTLVTYGSMVRMAEQVVKDLADTGVSAELIDVQTLLPFDINNSILKSVKKTNRIIFTDEDVPGGASAFMLQKVIEEQGAYTYLDSAPKTLCAHEHRTAYGSDGDYFSKPNNEDIFDAVYQMMHEADPLKFPRL
ncbi:MAG TPA: transketolase [Flavobacteriales bacterium]|nr:transketolase [Flavobacteriales bacterium]HIN38858.1 transketolase [Flavobacteriales bacterium]